MYEEVEPMGPRVATIIDIVGPRVMILRHYPKSGIVSIQAYVGMPIFQNDHIKCDRMSTCCAEFIIGGRAIVGSNHEGVISGHRELKVVGNQTVVTARKVWAKIDKQKSQLQIQTSGVVIGIEG